LLLTACLLAAPVFAESVEVTLVAEPEGVAESWTVSGAEVGVVVDEVIERSRRERWELVVELTERQVNVGRTDQVVFEAELTRVTVDRRGQEKREVLTRPRVTTLSDTEALVRQTEGRRFLELRITPRLDDDVASSSPTDRDG